MRRDHRDLVLLSVISETPGQAGGFLERSGILKSLPTNFVKKIQARAEFNSVVEIENVINTLPSSQKNIVFGAFRADPRIFGGRPVEYTEVPWQVALVRGYLPEPNRFPFCGGSLVARDTVLTAAHCVQNAIVQSNPARVAVIDGTSFYGAGGERLTVTALFVHPQYNAETKENDVAILKLASSSTLATPIKIIDALPPDGTIAMVTGWGVTESGQPSPDLLSAKIPLVSQQTCNAEASYGGAVKPTMLCAGARAGGLDACQGDSGGPLVVGEGANARLVGVVSWGEGCAQRLKYGVYANVPSLAGWINPLLGTQTASLATVSVP
jgi:secreted trypsin-like serine protease